LPCAAFFQAVEGSQGWLHLSIGRADRWQNWGIVSLVVHVVALLGGLTFEATGGVVASVLIAAKLFLRDPSRRCRGILAVI